MDSLERRFRISHLIAEQFAGVINEEDNAELEAWRNETTEHEKEYQELWDDYLKGKTLKPYPRDKVEREWKRFQGNNLRKRRQFAYWYRYAAIIILVVGVAAVLHWQTKRERLPVATESIQMAEGEVMLILSNGEKLVLNDSIELLKEEERAEIRVINQSISYQGAGKDSVKDAWNTLIIPRGGEYKIQLADGSRVWLNAETEFRYPVHFAGEKRQVYIKGEAYFEVAADVRRPFVVGTSGGVDVKVLGTKFNVSSYDDEMNVVTTLVQGSVEVGNEVKKVKIVPDEQLIFHKGDGSFLTQKVDATVYSAWKDGKIIFEEQRLEDIMRQLGRWYEMTVFFVNEEVKNYRFSGDLKKYDDFDQIVRMLEEVSGLQISIKDKCVVIGTK